MLPLESIVRKAKQRLLPPILNLDIRACKLTRAHKPDSISLTQTVLLYTPSYTQNRSSLENEKGSQPQYCFMEALPQRHSMKETENVCVYRTSRHSF